MSSWKLRESRSPREQEATKTEGKELLKTDATKGRTSYFCAVPQQTEAFLAKSQPVSFGWSEAPSRSKPLPRAWGHPRAQTMPAQQERPSSDCPAAGASRWRRLGRSLWPPIVPRGRRASTRWHVSRPGALPGSPGREKNPLLPPAGGGGKSPFGNPAKRSVRSKACPQELHLGPEGRGIRSTAAVRSPCGRRWPAAETRESPRSRCPDTARVAATRHRTLESKQRGVKRQRAPGPDSG